MMSKCDHEKKDGKRWVVLMGAWDNLMGEFPWLGFVSMPHLFGALPGANTSRTKGVLIL